MVVGILVTHTGCGSVRDTVPPVRVLAVYEGMPGNWKFLSDGSLEVTGRLAMPLLRITGHWTGDLQSHVRVEFGESAANTNLGSEFKSSLEDELTFFSMGFVFVDDLMLDTTAYIMRERADAGIAELAKHRYRRVLAAQRAPSEVK